jgi:hypothetical protein
VVSRRVPRANSGKKNKKNTIIIHVRWHLESLSGNTTVTTPPTDNWNSFAYAIFSEGLTLDVIEDCFLMGAGRLKDMPNEYFAILTKQSHSIN